MAKAAAKAGAKTSSGGISIVALLVITLFGAGAGGFFGMQVPGLTKSGSQSAKAEDPAEQPKAPFISHVQPLPPITTNIAQPSTTWMRIEAAIVVNADLGPEANVLAAKMSEDIIGYLRTVSLDQIEGASGFQHLREDLNDRVKLRSEGKVLELIIQSLILE